MLHPAKKKGEWGQQFPILPWLHNLSTLSNSINGKPPNDIIYDILWKPFAFYLLRSHFVLETVETFFLKVWNLGLDLFGLLTNIQKNMVLPESVAHAAKTGNGLQKQATTMI